MSSTETKSNSTKQVVFLAVLVLCAVLFVAGYVVLSRPSTKKIITSGDRAPDFQLPDLNGQAVTLSALRGKVVMVHFWATWCPPCVEEIPTLAKLYRQFTGKDFIMLAVSVDEGGAGAVTAFMQRNRLDLPVLLDPDRATAASYGTFKFPETYIVDREGTVRYKMIGARDWTDPAAVQIVQNIIQGK